MRFTHNGKRILLQGLKPDTIVCRPVSTGKLQGLLRRKAITHMVHLQQKPAALHPDSCIASVTTAPSPPCPAEIQAVLDQFPQVFQDSDALPPQRACDHSIDLLPGATPVNARVYRLPPDQKDEVEKQLKEMLQKGLIRMSASPFASPVLLVRKKDGSW